MKINIKNPKKLSTEDFYNIINSEGNNEIKDWLAKIGSERINEMFDPEIIIIRAINCWRMQGYSEKWITNKIKKLINNN